MAFALRPYQEEALRSLWGYFEEQAGSPVVVLPTASGKSVVIAEWIRAVFSVDETASVMVVSHMSELLTQNRDELLGLWPDAPVGIYSAKLGERDIQARIMFASIASIYKKAYEIPNRVDFLLIDECHLVSNNGTTMYRKFIDDLRVCNPALKVVGFSATPYRLGSGLLTDGDNRLFTDICYEAPILPMIEAGYLSPVRTVATTTKLDVANVGTSGGDYVQAQLQAAVDVDEKTQAIVKEIVTLAADRRTWLIFCSGVEHAEHTRDAIRAYGVTCETITGETAQADRARFIEGFRNGSIRCLTNANVLTTGLNVRPVDFLGIMRPTKSTALHVQIIGRGMRISPETGKVDCIVADFAGNVDAFGPIDKIRVKPKGKGGEAPTKTCLECEATVYASAKVCPNCGADFPPFVEKEKLKTKASTAAILSNQRVAPEWLAVQGVTYRKHEKPGAPPSLRVTYMAGLVPHSEWISLERTGYPRTMAAKWWSQRSNVPAPLSVDKALAMTSELRQPTRIAVRPSGKYTEIVAASFD